MPANFAKLFAKGAASRLVKSAQETAKQTYASSGRVPWSAGYSEFKNSFIAGVLRDENSMACFRRSGTLPPEYGARLDERVVEYPWVLSRLRSSGWILDAGSTFNAPLILELPAVKDRRLLIYTLEADYITLRPTVSYVFGDLRDTILRDELFESIVCISTLEHIGFGLDYRHWSRSRPYPDADPESFKKALAEFKRVLKPGGQLLLTVPYGRRENHGWLQQFNDAGVGEIKSAFGGRTVGEAYYKYAAEGWQIATAEECGDARYFNIHEAKGFDLDYAAAARSVVCLELLKN
jgi:SAM-dependent methyltransferase